MPWEYPGNAGANHGLIILVLVAVVPVVHDGGAVAGEVVMEFNIPTTFRNPDSAGAVVEEDQILLEDSILQAGGGGGYGSTGTTIAGNGGPGGINAGGGWWSHSNTPSTLWRVGGCK